MSLIRAEGSIAPVVRRRRKTGGAMVPIPTPYQGAGRQHLYMSDWWTNILVGAQPWAPNLDDLANVATLRRLASRYDVITIVDPHWHDVGWMIRDRLRQYATEQGRRITFLRYMGAMFVRWTDQTGHMSILPAQGVCATDGTIQDPSKILTSAAGVALRGKGSGTAYFVDIGSPAVVEACVANVRARLSGWDGMFFDEILASYRFMRGADYMTVEDPQYPANGIEYETARRNLMKRLYAEVATAGKIGGGNVDPYTTVAGRVHWPTAICQDNPNLRFPFIEAMWCADWGRATMTTAHAEWPVVQDLVAWVSWCQANGHEPILNTYSNNPAALKYGAALTVAAGGRQAIICGQAPNPATDEYADEPTWLPEYDAVRPMWSPTTPAHGGASTISRAFARGSVAADCSAGSGAFTAGSGGAPSTTPTPPSGTPILAEAFVGADGAAWPAKWASGMVLAGSTATIQGGRGQLRVGTSSPGVRTQRYVTSQFADFHALCTITLGGASQSLTMMLRSGDATLDEDSAYGVRLWADRLELIYFDASYSGTILTTSTRPHTVGQTWRMRVLAASSRLRANTWLAGDPEPAWAIDTTHTGITGPGHFGWSVQGYGTAGASTVASVDDLVVAQS